MTPAIASNTDIDKQVAEASEALTDASAAVVAAAESLKDAQAKLPAARETMAIATQKKPKRLGFITRQQQTLQLQKLHTQLHFQK
jgi:hypothetical protein